jgi:hypothetical protein
MSAAHATLVAVGIGTIYGFTEIAVYLGTNIDSTQGILACLVKK